jgi:hypothetical protein
VSAVDLLPGMLKFAASVQTPTEFTEYSFVDKSRNNHVSRNKKTSTVRILADPPGGDFGGRLRANKAILNHVFDDLQIAEERRVVMIAIAMQETNTMSPGERDWTNDHNTDKSANYSIFNLNEDFITQVTGKPPDPRVLPMVDHRALLDLQATKFAVHVINKAMDIWKPLVKVLVFHSGGGTAFNAYSPGAVDPLGLCKGYHHAIATIATTIEANSGLRSDHQRVAVEVPHH